jgi:hypothetical protein
MQPKTVMSAVEDAFHEIMYHPRLRATAKREIELDDHFYQAVEKELRGKFSQEEVTAAITEYDGKPGYSAEVLALQDLLEQEAK